MTEPVTRPDTDAMESAVGDIIEAFELPSPPFHFLIHWTRDYDQLLGGQYDEETEISGLLEKGAKY
jgi:hypothetical protein